MRGTTTRVQSVSMQVDDQDRALSFYVDVLGCQLRAHAISQGWPAVLANLKSLLETGDVLPQAPWEMSSRT